MEENIKINREIAKEIVRTKDYSRLFPDSKRGKSLVLLSGGLDSAVVLFLAKSVGFDTKGLEFFYEGRPSVESQIISDLCTIAGVELYQVRYPLATNNSPGRDGIHLNESNMIYCGLAGALAHKVGASTIMGGQIFNDWGNGSAPEATPKFYGLLNDLFALEYRVNAPRVVMPFLYLNKLEVAQIGKELNVPMEMTWSCPNSSINPCKTCIQCVEREEVLAQVIKK